MRAPTEARMPRQSPNLPEQPVLVPRKLAREMLGGISERTIRRMEKDQILTPYRLRPGGKVYYRLQDLLALVHQHSDDYQKLPDTGGHKY
jgi:hypothetical protein